MSRSEKLIQKLLSYPTEMRFSEVRKILEGKGYAEVRVKGSHHVFYKAGKPPISVSTVNGRTVKVDYLKKIAADLELE